jgi:putative ABC transport system permease protein
VVPADYSGEPLVSLADDIAEGLGLAVGDKITVNVLGRNVTARVANLRRLDWESLSINFVLVFSPNTFAGAPHSHLATLQLPTGSGREAERAVLSAVTPAFPGVTSVSVRDAITSVNAIISDLALAIRAAASLALFCFHCWCLGGALAAGHRQRRQDAVILKTLGATRGGSLGILAANTASRPGDGCLRGGAGKRGGVYVVTRTWSWSSAASRKSPLSAAAVAPGRSTLGSGWQAPGASCPVKSAAYLRNL